MLRRNPLNRRRKSPSGWVVLLYRPILTRSVSSRLPSISLYHLAFCSYFSSGCIVLLGFVYFSGL
ncbi:unnamed protein product [Linum tenue]|uniref:Uncharacterized protein n=1 Tax=Linum tenue TaxID=586396 RepID=A0AAV0IJ58_9ROSI|nr:unnamed protein product [Linum tenue]